MGSHLLLCCCCLSHTCYFAQAAVLLRFRTEAHQDVVARFNERFILSLASCSNCLAMDDELNILPITDQIQRIQPVMRNVAANADGSAYVSPAQQVCIRLKYGG